MPIIKLTHFDHHFDLVRDSLYRPIAFNKRDGERAYMTYTKEGFVRVVKPLMIRQNNFAEPIDNPLEPRYIDNSNDTTPTYGELHARHT